MGLNSPLDPTLLHLQSNIHNTHNQMNRVINNVDDNPLILAFRVTFHSPYAKTKTSRARNLFFRAEEHPRLEREEEGLCPPPRDAIDDKISPQGRFGVDRRNPLSYPCSCYIAAVLLPLPYFCPRCALERTITRSPT